MSGRTRTPGPAITAAWTRFAGPAGRGPGPIPWEHAPNRGFLRALYALAVAADRIGDTVEHERCQQFLRDSSETAYTELTRESSAPTVDAGDTPEEVR